MCMCITRWFHTFAKNEKLAPNSTPNNNRCCQIVIKNFKIPTQIDCSPEHHYVPPMAMWMAWCMLSTAFTSQ